MTDHDGRCLSAMDPETRLVHALLERWGRWNFDSALRPWPSTTLLGRLIEFGPNGASQQSRPVLTMPDEIAAVDAAVAKLVPVDKKALQIYYTRSQPLENCARELGVRCRQYRIILRRARWRVSGYLGLFAA